VKGALDVHRELLARDVPHEMLRLRSRALTADDLPRLLGLPTGCVAVRCYEVEREAGPSFAAVLVPAGRLPQPAALLEALGACSVRPAGPDAVNRATDYAAGLVSPLCLPPGVELLADSALGETDVCYCAVGEGQVVLGIRTRDLLVTTGARAAPLSGPSSTTEPGQVLHLERRSRIRSAG
jgi:Cys-tRNA(Pro)/Cys-tRNA(Cys) deacylase